MTAAPWASSDPRLRRFLDRWHDERQAVGLPRSPVTAEVADKLARILTRGSRT